MSSSHSYLGRNGRWKPDDIVVVSDPSALRGKWSIGRVLEVHPGPDGRVRNVEVKRSTGMYSRPMTKIAVIHPAEGDDQPEAVRDKDYALIGAENVSLIYI